MSSSPSLTHTLPSPGTSAAGSVLGVTSPRNMPEAAWEAALSIPASSEMATHSPSASDVLAALTRRLVSTTKKNVTSRVLPASTS